MNGVTILFVYAVIMILATVILTKKEKNVERFCVGSRSENWLMSALSIAATWIWAPALFVSTEKAYSTGWVGLFWFLVPNALCLVIFIPFAKRIRKEMPEGMTLSGYWNEPAATITTRFDTPAGGRFIHPDEDRTLSPREAARIQSFPDGFVFYGTRREISRQIGNAVPPKISYFLARYVQKILEQEE